MRNLLMAGAAAAAIVALTPAIGQTTPPPGVAPGTAPIVHVDTRIHRMPMKAETRDEAVAHAREMFGKLDTNRDGYVTKQEAEAAHKAMAGEAHEKLAMRFAGHDMPRPDRGAMFDKLDTNKDGSISREEYMAGQSRVQERHVIVMRDGDGPVEVDGKPVDADGGPDGGPGDPHVKIMRMHGAGMHKVGMHMFESADANKDGRVSLQEMTNAAVQHFDSADANHDGTLTPEERMQMHQRMKAEHAKPA